MANTLTNKNEVGPLDKSSQAAFQSLAEDLEEALLSKIDASSNNALHTAVAQGDLDNIRFVLKKRASLLDAPNNHGNNALHVAIIRGQLDTVRLFLEEKASLLDTTNNHGHSVLHLAALHGHFKIVRMLWEARASLLDTMDNHKQTPLQLAVIEDHLEVVKFLKAPYKASALEQCSNMQEFLRLLANEKKLPLNKGPKVSLSDALSPLDKVFLLFQVLSEPAKGKRILVLELEPWIKNLLNEYPALLGVKNHEGKTLAEVVSPKYKVSLTREITRVQKEKVKLPTTFDVLTANPIKTPALHLAVDKNNLDEVIRLLKTGEANLYELDEVGKTAAQLAPEKSQIQALLTCLARSPEQIEQDCYQALKTNNTELIKHLLAANKIKFTESVLSQPDVAQPKKKKKKAKGQQPQTSPTEKPTQKTIEISFSLALKTVSIVGNIESAKFLLEQPEATLSSVAEDNRTALHHAASVGNLEMVKFLLAQDVDLILATDKEGKSARQLAQEADCSVVSNLLQSYEEAFSSLSPDIPVVIRLSAWKDLLGQETYERVVTKVLEEHTSGLEGITYPCEALFFCPISFELMSNPVVLSEVGDDPEGIVSDQTKLDAYEFSDQLNTLTKHPITGKPLQKVAGKIVIHTAKTAQVKQRRFQVLQILEGQSVASILLDKLGYEKVPKLSHQIAILQTPEKMPGFHSESSVDGSMSSARLIGQTGLIRRAHIASTTESNLELCQLST